MSGVINEVLDGAQDLVEMADRGLAKLFNEPWPPVQPHSAPRHLRPIHYGTMRKPQMYSYKIQTSMTRTFAQQKMTRTSLSGKTEVSKATQRLRPKAKQTLEHAAGAREKQDVGRTPGMTQAPKLKKPAIPSDIQFPKAEPMKLARTGLRYDRASPHSLSSSKPEPKLELKLEVLKMQAKKPGIQLDDIRFDLDRCDVLLIAVAEMEICKEVFAGWRAQLDLATPRQAEKLEQSIIANVDQLDTGASAALRASHEILKNYRTFVHVIDRRLNELSNSKNGGPLFLPSDLQGLSTRLLSHSKALAACVKKMQERLRQLVRDIEKTKELADRRALRRKIWGWVSKAFKALAALLSAGGAVFAFFYPVGLLESAAIAGASMFSGAVAHLCQIVQDKYNETTFDEILMFLRDHVPESAKAAELALTSFQACQRVLQLELEVRQGKRSDWVSASEARRSRDHWAQASKKIDGMNSFASHG